jgi:ectoine hydroxylase-related dioxygenase (phytanoyl-CoA dioxygenase family)
MIVALRVHLDDSTPTNGPLRVLPRTHLHGILNQDAIRRAVETVSPVTCTVAAGGVVAMSPLVLHASSKARTPEPRRVLHVEYASCIRFDSGVELGVAA